MSAFSRIAIVIVAAIAVTVQPAAAQTGFRVAPSVQVGQAFDTNVFSQPAAQSDSIFRLTGALDVENTTPRVVFGGRYSFDAEQYREHPDLTSLMSRQAGLARMLWRPSPTISIAARGTYDRTNVPAELNLTTGLSLGRVTAARAMGGFDATFQSGARTQFVAGASLTRDQVEGIGAATLQELRLELRRDPGPQDRWKLKYAPEMVTFSSGAPDQIWHTVAAGWTHAVSKNARFEIEAGPRFGGQQVQPYASVILARSVTTSDLSIAYTRSMTTALGVSGPIEVQSLLATAGYHRPRGLAFSVQGGAFRDVVDRQPLLVYHAGGTIIAHLVGPLSLGLTVSHDQQRGRLGSVIAPLTGGSIFVSPDADVRRSVISVQLMLMPSFLVKPAMPRGLPPTIHSEPRRTP